jgi:hypothetical protein
MTVHEEWIDRREPVDTLEPIDRPADLIREARVEAVRLLNAFGSSLESALSAKDATLTSVKLRFWGICFSLGLNICEGRSQTEIAESLGYERATISKIAIEYCNANGLAPSFYMKSATAPAAYQSARLESIERANGSGE